MSHASPVTVAALCAHAEADIRARRKQLADDLLRNFNIADALDDGWFAIDQVEPPYEIDILLAGEGSRHVWRYGVACYGIARGHPVLLDWEWTFQPTHWRHIVGPMRG